MPEVTEFVDLDPKEFHLVPSGATGFPVLLAKAAELVNDEVEKARMDAKERHSLDDSDFAFPEQRKEPLNDEAHVRNAISRFSQVEDVSAEDKRKAAHRIMARAKELGIDVADDSDVARAAKETAPDKSVPTEEAETQTEEVSEDCATGASPEANDGGEPQHVAAADERPAEGDGQGDTAPDASVPRGEADSQTDDAQKTADAAKTTDPEPEPETSTLQKEIQDMTYDELTKLLDERDAARRAEKEARKRAEAKKAQKREKKAAKVAAKAAEAADDAPENPDLAKARADLTKLQERVEKMESEDAKRIVTDPTGIVTALRGGADSAANVFKQLEDELAKAKEVWEKNPTRANEARMKEAGTRVVNAKLIAQDTARTSDPRYVAASLRGQGFPLFNNSNAFNDPKVQYDRGR